MGYLQESIIKLGKQNGIVSIDDVSRFYPHNAIRREMSKLVNLGFFEEVNDGYKVYWKYKDDRNKTNSN